MNDKLLLENYLLILKSNMEVYVHGTLESSNESVRKLLNKCLNKTLDIQYDTFNLMRDLNYYKVTNVNTSNIKKVIKNTEN